MTFSAHVILERSESNAGLLGHKIVALSELAEVDLLLGSHAEELLVVTLRLVVSVDRIGFGTTPIVTLLG